MRLLSSSVTLAAFASRAAAHYIFPQFVANGVTTNAWQYVRQTTNWETTNPVTDVTTTDIRCYTSNETDTSSTFTVAAGSTVGFIPSPSMYHQSVVNVYMAKAPAGTDVSAWDGSGAAWFRIFEVPAQTDGGTSINWPATLLTQVDFTIPSQLPSGQYLIRVENIALHVAEVFGGAQFYLACAQVAVTNGGSGVPGPLVSFPGAYTGNEPGILINIYFPIPPTYTQPGPPLWPAVGGSPPPTSAPATTSKPATTSNPVTTPTTTIKTTSTPVTTVSTSPPQSTGTVAEWGQCGGQEYVGPTVCVSPFACTELNPFFFQCL